MPAVNAYSDWTLASRRRSGAGFYLASLLVHFAFFMLVLYAAGIESRQLEAQRQRFLEDIQRQQQQIAEQERQFSQQAAADRRKQLAEQLGYEMDFLITPDLDEDLHTELMDDMAIGIDDMLDSVDGFEAFTADQLAELAGQLRLDAFDMLRGSVDELRRKLLIARIRSYIRNDVVPTIESNLENRLKNDVGKQLDSRAAKAAASQRRKRISSLGSDLTKISRAMTAAARSEQAITRDVQRKRVARAVDSHKKLVNQWGDFETKLDGLLDEARVLAPALKSQIEAITAARPDRPGRPDKQAAARLQAVTESLKKDKDSDDQSPQARSQIEAAIKAASDAQNRSAVEYRKMADLLNKASRAGTYDSLERAQVAAAAQETAESVRQRVSQEVLETAVPIAAEKIMTVLEDELRQRRLHTKKFRDFLESDILAALDENVRQNMPDTHYATERLRRRYSMADSEQLRKAAEEAAAAAAKLSSLIDRQSDMREQTATTGTDPALRQGSLASEISGAYGVAANVLKTATTATVSHERDVATTKRHIGRRIAPSRASGASSTLRRELLDDAKVQMQAAEADMLESANMLVKLSGKLSSEADAVEARAKAGGEAADLSALPGCEDSDASVAAISKAMDAAVDQTLEAAARRSSETLDLRDMFSDEDLDSANMLADRLGQMADNMADGRGLEGIVDFAMLGPGMRAGGAPGSGMNWGVQVRRHRSNYNRDAYEQFVKFLRHRLNPANYYGDPPQVEGLDTIATEILNNSAEKLVVLEDSATKDTATIDAGSGIGSEADSDTGSDADRKIPEPQFPHRAFGAAAMMDRSITIDGDLSDWGELDHPLKLKFDRNEGVTHEDGPEIYLRWSPEGFYIAYVVADDNGIQPCETHSWSGDCLEFMIDMANSRLPDMTGNVNAHKYSFSPFGCRGRADLTLWEMGRGMNGLLMAHDYPDTAGVKGRSAARLVPGGYSVECFLSRRALTLPALVAGRYVGVNFSLNRGYEGGLSRLWACSSALATWRKPDTWGDMLLLGSDAKIRFPIADTEGGPGDAAAILPGDILEMEISDADMNLNVEQTDRISAMVSMAGAGGGIYVVLAETGKNTGVFRASVNTAQYFMAPVENTLSVRSGGRVQLQYTDARAAYGEKNLPVTAELPVAWPVLKVAARDN